MLLYIQLLPQKRSKIGLFNLSNIKVLNKLNLYEIQSFLYVICTEHNLFFRSFALIYFYRATIQLSSLLRLVYRREEHRPYKCARVSSLGIEGKAASALLVGHDEGQSRLRLICASHRDIRITSDFVPILSEWLIFVIWNEECSKGVKFA